MVILIVPIMVDIMLHHTILIILEEELTWLLWQQDLAILAEGAEHFLEELAVVEV
jgi:hypothetical protein